MGLSRASITKGSVAAVTTAFWTIRKRLNFYLMAESECPSLSDIIPAAIMNPRMHPMGIDRPPSAVDRALSLSPNQELASLLEELIKKPWPKAAMIVPGNMNSNLSVAWTKSLSQDPKRRIVAPTMWHDRRPNLLRI